MRRAIQVFLKFPTPGQVKTRLASEIGEEAAARAYEAMVGRVLELCRRARPDLLNLAFSPAEKEEDFRKWLRPWLDAFPGELEWVAQVGTDLGERLEYATQNFFERHGDANLAVIGTDCVDLDPDLFESTWQALEQSGDVVFGPTVDGGYYLVGLSEAQPEVFRGIPWSISETLHRSRDAAKRAGRSVTLLPERNDIDHGGEWKAVADDLEERFCVFFDRDGVVNQSPGAGYVLSEDEFVLHDGIAEALREIHARNGLAIVVTSQKGVGKGLMTEATLQEIHRRMQTQLSSAGSYGFDGILAYTGTPDCLHRPKPDPEMIETACRRFSIDPGRSWMIGDADRDIVMGKKANLRGTIRIRGEKAIGEAADHTLDSTTEIAEILRNVL